MENFYYAQFHTSAELESIFSRVFGGRLEFCGFETIAARKWVQETGLGFKYLFSRLTAKELHTFLVVQFLSTSFRDWLRES